MTASARPRTFIIAEAGVNHNGSPDLARKLVHAAKEAGADAVKFQTFIAERLVTKVAQKAEYQKVTSGAEESQFAMLKRLELSEAMHRELHALCASLDLEFMSTPFDEASADFLMTLGVARFKAPSGEITNFPYLRHLASLGRPIILSTGMSHLAEVELALAAIRDARDVPVTVLHCVSNYPTAPETVNLRAMVTMREALEVETGFSDHTMGRDIAMAAVALGAAVIEKHLTLDRTLPGPDHAASVEPDEFRALVEGIRSVELALGDGIKRPAASETAVAGVIRKGLVAARDIAAGAALGAEDVAILRPATGLPPSERERVLGKKARAAISAGTPLTYELLA
jgi:N-acetylneuraminate synthase